MSLVWAGVLGAASAVWAAPQQPPPVQAQAPPAARSQLFMTPRFTVPPPPAPEVPNSGFRLPPATGDPSRLGRTLVQPPTTRDMSRRGQAPAEGWRPAVVCAARIVPADPNIDPRFVVPSWDSAVEYTMRVVPGTCAPNPQPSPAPQ